MNLMLKFILLLLLAVFMVNLATTQTIFEAVERGNSKNLSNEFYQKSIAHLKIPCIDFRRRPHQESLF